MAWDWASKELGAADEFVELRIPNDGQRYHILYRLTGTFTATITAEAKADSASSYSSLTTTDVDGGSTGNPTGAGLFGAKAASGDDSARVRISSFTSGTVRVEAALVPDA